jgi:GntR family transcriptional regulator / MocR family aminotransferase
MPVPFSLDRDSPVPLQRQIYDEWRGGILGGRFRAGMRLPSTRALARTYGISRITVTAAYDQLLAEGYLETRRGSGTFVSTDLPDDRPASVRLTTRRVPAAAPIRPSAYASRLGSVVRRPVSTAPINLSNASPDVSRFPFSLWRRLVSRHLRRTVPEIVGAAAGPHGYPMLRREIATYLARTRAVRCTPDQVIVVNGSQQALDLCARLLLDPDDAVAVEEPGYAGVRQLFAAHGARLHQLPVTDAGASLANVGTDVRVVHVTPSHQFPTGVSMTLPRRLELLDWARGSGAVIIEDDYDSEYRYSGPPLPAMHSLGTGATVIYVGTFSNVMFYGLRLGYVVVPPGLLDAFATAKWLADRNSPMLEQAALADFIAEGHLDRHVRRMRRLYKRRRDVLLDAIARAFGDAARIRGDAAGMHLSVRLPDPRRVRANAAKHGVHIAGSELYYVGKAPADEFLVSFSAIAERTIREGIRRLAV